MPVIMKVRDAKKEYQVGDNTVHAVDGVSFSVNKGDWVLIYGRSGSGKSTLLNLLAGLEPPTSGEILIRGKHIEKMSEGQRIRFRREHIGFVFQSYNLLPQYSALENVAMPLALRGMPKKEREEEAMKMLEQVGLAEHAEHKPSELSGGQQQRVGIARAIITAPEIVFADEPTGNLDTKTGEEVMELLKKIFKERKTTFILVSHDPDMRRYAGREIHIQDGIIQTEESVISGGKVI